MTSKAIPLHPALTQERLKQLLHYDPLTGIFTRRVRVGRFQVGEVAGFVTKSTGYVVIGVDGIQYYGHRLAWLYVKGEWPDPQCDHEDRIRHNNVWTNLREASIPEQRQNQKPRKDSKSGLPGVSWMRTRNRYRARITINGVTHILGQAFITAEDAHAAYVEAKARLHIFNPTVRGLPASPQSA